MQHGFIKVGLAIPSLKVGSLTFNAGKIIELMDKAYLENVRVLVFPELCLTSYTLGDLFYQDVVLDSAIKALIEVKKSTIGKRMLVFLGLPLRINSLIYNVCATIFDGKILGIVPKSYIPNYNEFYEKRQFASGRDLNTTIFIDNESYEVSTNLIFKCIEIPNLSVAVEICEDLWVMTPPSCLHAKAGASVIVNLSASNELIGKPEYRRNLVIGQSARLISAYLYVSASECESSTDLVYSGHSLIAENGKLLVEKKPFESSELITTEIDVNMLSTERAKLANYYESLKNHKTIFFSLDIHDTTLTRFISKYPFVPSGNPELTERAEFILSLQAHGLKKRIEHLGPNTKLVLGLSGGLDSALALLVCMRAIKMLNRNPLDILAVSMPGFATSQKTKKNAKLLAITTGVSFFEININKSCKLHLSDIGHTDTSRDTTYENAQARERTKILMDLANKYSGIVVGTGDLSELALGWSTYNGDHMSMYGVNASVPKTLVKYLISHEAERDIKLKKVLSDILDTPISPELLPSENNEITQKTEDIVGPYELHDFFLYYLIRQAFPPSKVFRLTTLAYNGYYTPETIKRWLLVFIKRFFSNQFKRSCLPDCVKIGTVSLSPRGDWRMPSDAECESWIRELEEYLKDKFSI
ncbi:MAG: NAD(+) synthase [Christensenellaceae bacterium]|jgi:NAD+ synthase (glutamine-hydrolysing)|nr:NAD(+) synthase [Christensenellaceae bacterium]